MFILSKGIEKSTICLTLVVYYMFILSKGIKKTLLSVYNKQRNKQEFTICPLLAKE